MQAPARGQRQGMLDLLTYPFPLFERHNTPDTHFSIDTKTFSMINGRWYDDSCTSSLAVLDSKLAVEMLLHIEKSLRVYASMKAFQVRERERRWIPGEERGLDA